jgi:hypothetical protein
MRNTFCMMLAALATVASVTGSAQVSDGSATWRRATLEVDSRSKPFASWIENYQTFRVDVGSLQAQLGLAPRESGAGMTNFSVMDLPMPDGSMRKYKVVESPILSPELEQKIGVKTYMVQSIDNPRETGRIDFGPNGFHGFVRGTDGGSFVIEPVAQGRKDGVFVYYRRDNTIPRQLRCLTQEGSSYRFNFRDPSLFTIMNVGGTLKSYRLAMNATGEYTAFHGGEVPALAAIATTVNRVNSIYMVDVAIRLNIIYSKAWTDPNTDPYTNNNVFAMLAENQTETDASVGNTNYDMGHVFGTGDGGVAALNSVGVAGIKAQGVTGLPQPVGDPFDVDYVCHEMGHQFGGRHTFANCQGGNDPGNDYEPGSGTTIMAYAGICGGDNVQMNSDPYFHTHNLDQIVAWRNNSASGGSEAVNLNAPPTANANADITIPRNTPFKLRATGTDPDNDPITFCWEQFDLGNSSVTGVLFRSINPSASNTRFFPKLSTVLAGTTDRWEALPAVDRSMKFRITVRDTRPSGGGHAIDDMNITVVGAPFSVTSPNGGESWLGNSSPTVTWDKGGSTAPTVNILLSTDGGNSYGNGTALVLATNTPNDGSETVLLPNNIDTTNARIIVESSAGSGFYDISNADFTVTPDTSAGVPVVTSISPTSATAGGAAFTLTVNGENFVPNSTVQWFGANRPTTFVNANQLTATVSASDIAFAQIVKVRVVTPPPGGGASNERDFTINNPVPTLDSIAPAVRAAGAGAFTLTVKGKNYVSSSKISWNGVQRSTTFISTTELKSTISAAEIATAGTAQVRVVNPAPGGGTTAAQTFTIVANGPTSIAVFPRSLTGGQAATAAVYLNAPAPAGGLNITLSSNNAAISIPGSVTAAAGKYSGVFTVNSNPVASTQLCSITASANGLSVSGSVTVIPPQPITMTLDPSSVNSGQGSTGTFTLNGPAPAGGLTVQIRSGVPGIVQVPQFVVVPAGATSGTFQITTRTYSSQVFVGVWALYANKGAGALLNVNP